MTLLIMSLSGLALLFAVFAAPRLRRGHWLRACGDGSATCLRMTRTGPIAGQLHDAARAAVREWLCTATRPR